MHLSRWDTLSLTMPASVPVHCSCPQEADEEGDLEAAQEMRAEADKLQVGSGTGCGVGAASSSSRYQRPQEWFWLKTGVRVRALLGSGRFKGQGVVRVRAL